MKTSIVAVLVVCLSYLRFTAPPEKPVVALEHFFRQQLGTVAGTLSQLETDIRNGAPLPLVRQHFTESRLAYKKSEWLLEYYYPHLMRSINGPALPFADGENSKEILPPKGFQVIEEQLFTPGQALQPDVLLPLISGLRVQLTAIRLQTDPFGWMDHYLFDALRFEVYRIIALGISGYDSPVALQSMQEATAALEGVQYAAQLYAANLPQQQARIDTIIAHAIQYLRAPVSFNDFDRLHFITTYANPLSTALLELQQQLRLHIPRERRILSPESPHLFAMSYYNANGYTPNYESDPTPLKTTLGKQLFYDPLLSGNGQRSCASCHQPERAFTDGLARNTALDGSTIARNTPTLFNAAFQSKLFYDSRAVFLEHQVADVVHNKKEMGGSLETLTETLRRDSSWQQRFAAAFPDAVTETNIANAIASYLRSLTSLQSPFDQYMHGNTAALTPQQIHGFNIFMGKGKCGTCHFAPLFNGVAPPYFAEPESEVLGVPATNRRKSPVDNDPGKFLLYQIPIQQYAFKTPTVRNSAVTAPYMHNGVFPDLQSVVDFYDKGGGDGRGIDLDNQTLPREKLRLTRNEQKALIAFMEALTDTSSYQQTYP